jgi:cytosine/adenosine deaminase-related metal-dependent hydrolase
VQRAELILPSLVNAHVHLELSPLSLSSPPTDFLSWIDAVLKSRFGASSEHVHLQASSNLRMLRGSGTGTLSEVDSQGFGALALAAAQISEPFASRCDAEILGFNLDPEEARVHCEERLTSLPDQIVRGLSPHAPYSVSPSLFREAFAREVPLSIHVSETPEEVQFCQKGEGPFRDLLQALGKLPKGFEAPGCSPLAHLSRLEVLGEKTLLVHMQEVCTGDLEILAEAGSPVVICPGTISYFGRPSPAYEAFRENGVLCALGTDSLASNDCLNMFSELARFHRMFPKVDGLEVLKLGTSEGGKALGLPGAGRLSEGDSFDALLFSDFPKGNEEETTDILLSGRIPLFIPYARGRSVL